MDEEYDFTNDTSNHFMNWTEDYLNDLDTSQYPFPNTLWHIKEGNEIAIKTTVMLTIAIPGLYLNSVILVVLAKNKWLWSPSNFLVGNLSLIDFLTLLFCPWFMLVRDFYQNFVLKNFGCRFEGFLQASLLLANVFAVILVSYDRLAAATLPTDARITKKAAPRLIVYSWIISLLFSLPWIISREYVERQWLDYLETYCVENSYMLKIYWHFIIVLLVWVPLGVMVLTYGAIMWRLERSARQLSSRGGGQLVARAKGRTLRVTACLLLADVACRVPYSILIYVRNRSSMEINWIDGSYSVLWFAASTLMYLNCAVNPLIYGFTNNRLLKAMDRTPGVAYCKFGSWCCICTSTKKKELRLQDKNTEKIFIIESTPRPNKKITRIIKNILHINAEAIDLSIQRLEEGNTKPTKITPLKVENANNDKNENIKNDNEATKLTPLKPDDNNDKNENDVTKITPLALDIDKIDKIENVQSGSEEMNIVCESL